jgi:hypothetical protein
VVKADEYMKAAEFFNIAWERCKSDWKRFVDAVYFFFVDYNKVLWVILFASTALDILVIGGPLLLVFTNPIFTIFATLGYLAFVFYITIMAAETISKKEASNIISQSNINDQLTAELPLPVALVDDEHLIDQEVNKICEDLQKDGNNFFCRKMVTTTTGNNLSKTIKKSDSMQALKIAKSILWLGPSSYIKNMMAPPRPPLYHFQFTDYVTEILEPLMKKLSFEQIQELGEVMQAGLQIPKNMGKDAQEQRYFIYSMFLANYDFGSKVNIVFNQTDIINILDAHRVIAADVLREIATKSTSSFLTKNISIYPKQNLNVGRLFLVLNDASLYFEAYRLVGEVTKELGVQYAGVVASSFQFLLQQKRLDSPFLPVGNFANTIFKPVCDEIKKKSAAICKELRNVIEARDEPPAWTLNIMSLLYNDISLPKTENQEPASNSTNPSLSR